MEINQFELEELAMEFSNLLFNAYSEEEEFEGLSKRVNKLDTFKIEDCESLLTCPEDPNVLMMKAYENIFHDRFSFTIENYKLIVGAWTFAVERNFFYDVEYIDAIGTANVKQLPIKVYFHEGHRKMYSCSDYLFSYPTTVEGHTKMWEVELITEAPMSMKAQYVAILKVLGVERESKSLNKSNSLIDEHRLPNLENHVQLEPRFSY